MTADQVWTVNAIKEATRARGSHWFDPDTMRMFGTRVLPTVYQGPGGVFFVTEDDQYRRELPKQFTIRRFLPETAAIETVGEVCGSKNLKAARLKARNLARAAGELADVRQNEEKFQPVGILEQLVCDLRTHGNAATSPETARQLINAAYRHQHYATEACNTPEGAAFAERNMPTVRKLIEKLAEAVGATGVRFSGDPRGCTVKLLFADGATNDFGKEGWCVPTSTKED